MTTDDTSAAFPPAVIDAHMHLWDLSLNRHPWLCGAPIAFRYGDYSAIRRTYLVADYLRDAGPVPVEATVYVETEWDRADPLGETRWVHELARAEGLPNAVVAHAVLDDDDATDVIAAQATFALVRSVRHKPAAAPSPLEARRGAPGSMDDPRWREGFAQLGRHGLHFDLQTPWWHFDAAADLATDFPATTIILNHTGLPADRSLEGIDAWRQAMTHLAGCPNVHVKISGLGVRGARWDARANTAIVEATLSLFGEDRCLFASNFPVDSLVGDLPAIFGGFAAMVADRPPAVRRALFHDNAASLYGISPGARLDQRQNNTGGRP